MNVCCTVERSTLIDLRIPARSAARVVEQIALDGVCWLALPRPRHDPICSEGDKVSYLGFCVHKVSMTNAKIRPRRFAD